MVSFLIIFAIFMSFDSVALKERKVNLAFKTELEFNKESDIQLIEKIQRYLDQIKKILLKDSIAKRKELISEKRYTFTDFLNECVNVVKLLKDTEINNIIKVLTGELKKINSYHNIIDIKKHASLRKVLENNDLTSKNIRRKLNNFLLRLETREKGDFLLELINSFYKKDSEKKLKKFVNNLYLYKKGKLNNLNQIVRKGIQNIFVKHYLNLDESEKKEINMFITNILKNTDSYESESNIEDKDNAEEFYHEYFVSKQNPITKSRFPAKFKKFRHSYNSDYDLIGRKNNNSNIQQTQYNKTKKYRLKINDPEKNFANYLTKITISSFRHSYNSDYDRIGRKNNNSNIQQTQYNKTKKYRLKINDPEKNFANYLTKITINDDSIFALNNSDKSELDEENVNDEILAENEVYTVSIAMRKVKEIRHKTNDTDIPLNWTTKKMEKGKKSQNMNSTTDLAITSNKENQSKNAKNDSITTKTLTNLTKKDNDVTKSPEPLSRVTFIATSNTLAFDFNEFIKKSNYRDGDRAKNKEIEEKMKADLSKLFSDLPNNTNNGTERPDSFQELEKAFDFD